MGSVGDRGGLVGVNGSENGNLRVVRGGGSGSGSVRGSGTEWLVGMRVVGESCSGKSVRGSGSSNGDREYTSGGAGGGGYSGRCDGESDAGMGSGGGRGWGKEGGEGWLFTSAWAQAPGRHLLGV